MSVNQYSTKEYDVEKGDADSRANSKSCGSMFQRLSKIRNAKLKLGPMKDHACNILNG